MDLLKQFLSLNTSSMKQMGYLIKQNYQWSGNDVLPSPFHKVKLDRLVCGYGRDLKCHVMLTFWALQGSISVR